MRATILTAMMAVAVPGCIAAPEPGPELIEEPIAGAEQELPLYACYAPPFPPPSSCVTDADCDDGSGCTEAACFWGQCYRADYGKGTPCMTPTGILGSCLGSNGACCENYPSWAYVCKKPFQPPASCTTAADCWTGSACAVMDCVAGVCTMIATLPETTPCRYNEQVVGACRGENPAAADHCCL